MTTTAPEDPPDALPHGARGWAGRDRTGRHQTPRGRGDCHAAASARERDYWLRLAESQRAARQHARDREMIGSRALSAQWAETACGGDAYRLAELFAGRLYDNWR